MRQFFVATVLGLAFAATAQAQDPGFRPIDSSKLVVGPSDATAKATSGTIRTVGRVIANTIEDNGIVRTLNNLLGRRPTNAPVQAGFSSYPAPSSYASTRYQSMIKPQMPTVQTYGTTPRIPK